MKRRRSSQTYRRERMIIIVSSILVLTAMTVTGVSIYRSNQKKQQGKDIVDFSVLENGTDKKDGEVAQAQISSARNRTSGQADTGELDYDPYYAEKDRQLNEQEVNAPGQKAEESTDQESTAVNEESDRQEAAVGTDSDSQEETDETGQQEAAGAAGTESATEDSGNSEGQENALLSEEEGEALEAVANVLQEESNLHFEEIGKLEWPIVGNVILNYSMDKTIYFQTLQQYKYNPSIVIGATQGTNVSCAADGVVKSIYQDPQTGTTLVMNLGDGYELTYGQLTDIMVEEGEFVESGVFIGKVAAPTKYYTREGTNIYFKLTKDGQPVDPLGFMG